MKKTLGVLAAFVVTFVVAFVLTAPAANAFFGFGKFTELTPEQGMVTIDLADVSDGKAHYYKVEHKGVDVQFFVLKSSDGVYRAAFDACDVCFREKKGYSQDGDFMICNNCGQRFHSARINEVRGGCNPAPLERTYDDKTLTIRLEDIATGVYYFV